MKAFYIVTQYKILSLFQCFESMCCLHFQGGCTWFRWMMIGKRKMYGLQSTVVSMTNNYSCRKKGHISYIEPMRAQNVTNSFTLKTGVSTLLQNGINRLVILYDVRNQKTIIWATKHIMFLIIQWQHLWIISSNICMSQSCSRCWRGITNYWMDVYTV